MLNKLSFNLMNELNESETNSISIKKKVIIESDKISTKNMNELEESNDLSVLEVKPYKNNDGANILIADNEGNQCWFDVSIKDNDFTYDFNQYIFDDNNETDLKTKQFQDKLSTIYADDIYTLISTTLIDNNLLSESEEPTHQILNEENSDAVDRLFSGNELYFRNADGTAIMIHYADNYPQPEEYDEGYKAEFGGNEADLNAAQIAAENGDVWELVEVDNEGNSTGTIYGYAYGIDELKGYLKDLREVKVKKSLEEDMIDDNIEAARQDSIEKGLTSESEEVDLDEPNEDDNKNILQAKKDELEARLGEILMSIKDRQMDTEEFRALSREAAELDSQITDLDNQLQGLYEGDCSKEVKENCNDKKDNESNKPITEANVSKKIMLKNQGNVYMFECKGNKDFTHIVGENFNESENLLENVEVYNSKEEADKDYNKRCGLE